MAERAALGMFGRFGEAQFLQHVGPPRRQDLPTHAIDSNASVFRRCVRQR